MSTDSADRVIRGLDDQLAQALVARCRLSTNDLERIADTMRGMRVNFVDAAMHLGLVTPKELDEAVAAMRASGVVRDGPGIIEAAVRRQSAARSVMLVHSVLARPARELLIAHAPDHPHSERIRALRTELLLRNEPGLRANMLAVLSPVAGEGRSQLAAELAIALAQIGRRTLLVDADLRRPRQHELFESENTVGLAQALEIGGPGKYLGVEGMPHLSVLPAGPGAPNPSELLAGRNAERIVRLWGHDFEFVVADTPPIDQFSDGLILATLLGRVLIASRVNISTHRSMKDLMRRLGSTQCRVLGSVMSRF
jgi:protein-tyrosine kinase